MNLSGKWHIERFTSALEEEWDEFIDNLSLNSTFLHSRRFFKHNSLNQDEDCSFVFYKKGKIGACIPAVIVQTSGRKVWNSHLRSTYGGLLVSEGVGLEDVIEITYLLEGELRSNKIDEAIIRNTFRIFNRKFCDEFDYALWKTGYNLKSREVEIGVFLKNKTYQEIEKGYDNGNKYNIKKALKQVEVKFSEDYNSFWNILEKNLMEKHGQKPVHDLTTFIKLKNLLNPGEVKLVASYIGENMLGGMIIFDFRNSYLHAQYIASGIEHQNIRPVNAIIDYTFKWACENKYEYFNLGTPNEQHGHEVNLGLSYFKEGFGGRSCLRETMHKIYTYDEE